MRSLRLVLIAMLLALPFAATANAQEEVGVGVGPAVVPAPMDYGPRYAIGVTTLITHMRAPLTAITGHSGSMAASSSASDRGITGAGMDAAVGQSRRLRLSRRICGPWSLQRRLSWRICRTRSL